MQKPNKYILTIAGFDPSGGAGILADVKTFEQNKCIGLAVQTANTIQTESDFLSPNWVERGLIISQLETLLKSYKFDYIKIGLIVDLELANILIDKCLFYNSKSRIIWDPILSSSSGYEFNHSLNEVENLIKKLYLITPNWNEIKKLSQCDNSIEGAKKLSNFTKVVLKGGHNPEALGKDFLFEEGESKIFNPKPIKFYSNNQ